MMSKYGKQLQKGFTLVELLIVVIILAILAAIVVPQFNSTTDDARVSSMQSNLVAMRSAIDLYYLQHGKYPGNGAVAVACSADGGAATSLAFTPASFKSQLTFYSNSAGDICATKDSVNYKYGPYLREIPKTSISGTESSVVEILATADDGKLTISATSTDGGWKFDSESGLFIINHTIYEAL